MGLAYPFAGSLVSHDSLPVFDPYSWKYRSLVAPKITNPSAVATNSSFQFAFNFTDATAPGSTLTRSPCAANALLTSGLNSKFKGEIGDI
jgi:hypothetical protein